MPPNIDIETYETSGVIANTVTACIAVGPLNPHPQDNLTIVGASASQVVSGVPGYLTAGVSMRADLVEAATDPTGTVASWNSFLTGTGGRPVIHEGILPLSVGSEGGTAAPAIMLRAVPLPNQ